MHENDQTIHRQSSRPRQAFQLLDPPRSDFATAVAFEFLDSDKVRDPNLYAGTMGRYTSGPQGIVGTNYVATVTMILIQLCDSDLSRHKTRINYNDALLVSGFCS